MKASELRDAMAELIAKHGDLDVLLCAPSLCGEPEYSEIGSLDVRKPWSAEPPHIVIE